MWQTNNEIYIDDITKINPYFIPQEIIKEGEPWIKHVNCNGARFHVLSYRGKYNGECEIRCSEKNCIYNKPKEN